MPSSAASSPTDLVVVGAGIVGLSFAAEALRRGMSVAVVERDAAPTGASVRNFGHGCVTAQSGLARRLAVVARENWVRLGRLAGFEVQQCGTVVVARSEAELAVAREFCDQDDSGACFLTAQDVLARVPVGRAEVRGGAFLPMDIRVDPSAAAPALAAWLISQGVAFDWRTAVLGIAPGVVSTTRGDRHADTVVVAVGHDVDQLYPDVAEAAGVRRCNLQMLRVAPPNGAVFGPAVLTGTSLLRYSGFAACPSLPWVRDELSATRPQLLDADVNLMLTQRPGGDLILGDTHTYTPSADPFSREDWDELLLVEGARLLGVPRLQVTGRWRGVYASAPGREFMVDEPAPGVRVVSVTSGIGMTTALGLAPYVLDSLGG